MTTTLGPRFELALLWANSLHATQRRKASEVPYVSHLLGVCDLVLQNGGTEEQAIAALLHDSMEDQGVTRKEIEQRFGPHVADLVEACTDATVIPKPPWQERKEAFLARLESAEPDAVMVVACDKLHNLRATLEDLRRLGPQVWERFKAGRDPQIWYYQAFLDCSRSGEPRGLFEEIRRTLAHLEEESRPPSHH